MQISTPNPEQQTLLFIVLCIVVIFSSIRLRKKNGGWFPVEITHELKGFAMLAIVISHIGYFLSSDTRFLFPLSIMAGVGVDLFLVLSGYGLTVSALRKSVSIGTFYIKRLPHLYIPMWITLIIFLILDFFILHKTYPLSLTIKNFLGFFPSADIFNDINSPLWFFTIIVAYYILFPLVWSKKVPFISSAVLFIAGYQLVTHDIEAIRDVNRLYELHFMAFPLGIILAELSYRNNKVLIYIRQKLSKTLSLNTIIAYGVRYGMLTALAILVGYFSLHSQVDWSKWAPQELSIALSFGIIAIALLKHIEFKFFTIVGIYSYEMYLLHWPIMYRFDFLYRFIPAWVATALYIAVFLGVGWLIENGVERLLNFKKPKTA
ncbi:MAG: acyltransferase [Candidatus Magasanikbacteria bacterium]